MNKTRLKFSAFWFLFFCMVTFVIYLTIWANLQDIHKEQDQSNRIEQLEYQQIAVDNMTDWLVARSGDLQKRVWELENPGESYPLQIPIQVEEVGHYE